MRLSVSITIACLLTVGLAGLTPASAEPGHDCADKDIVDGHVRVTLERDCTLEVAVLEGIICVGGWGGSVEQEAAGHEATVYYCDGGLGDRVDDLIDLQVTTSSCGPVHGDSPLVAFAVRSDCTAAVRVIDGERVCGVGGLGSDTASAQAAGNDVSVGYCTVSPPTASAPGCKPFEAYVVGSAVHVEQAHNCRVTLTTKLYDCVWGGYWHETTVDPLTWRDYRCEPTPQPTSANAAAAPVDWCEVRDDTPAPLQDPVWGRYDEGADGKCDVDVEPFGACVGGSGSYAEKRYDPLHVKLLICHPGPGTLPPIS